MTTVDSGDPDDERVEERPKPTARRIVLGAQLRRLREAADITRAQAADEIRGSESKISRIELAKVSLKERDVRDLLKCYGVTDEQQQRPFLEMVRESKQPGWWNRYSDLMPDWFQDYVGLEESASRIQSYELQFVPGLLQIEPYAKAIASHGRPELADERVRRRVALRMQRQKLLNGPNAPRLWIVIDESVLHRPIGGLDVMRQQLDHLLEMTKRSTITLQVVPYRLSGYAAEGSFSMLRFAEPELPNLVYVEHLGGALHLDKPEEIEQYSRVFDHLTVDAETPETSRKLLHKVRAEL
ncbi:XRE family transcriptional regulator [Actinopolyspora erythraea]|uniref:XRE family transcriptional regulator n=1 Tax=Actinopolyspora erythraea TaxID=414996 RepID=A0A099D140_9ACTN|nr:helix-turn-helix transcriptional regulator [Actinopolyspora erythraea]ASU79819.1 XRE family transcriptional regulator [Actinopolyspora erythraea]KGI79661.1 XRE family transcriptional regulator [Actinopolyspora erythraea]